MGVAPIPEHRQEANPVVKYGHSEEQAEDLARKGQRRRDIYFVSTLHFPNGVLHTPRPSFFLAFALFFIENDLYIKDLKNISTK